MTISLSYDLVDSCSSILDGEFRLASNNPKKRAGRIKFSETRHPIYRGVRRRNSRKCVCELRGPNKKSRIWIGTYPTVEMAARAHDVAAIALRGKLACLNFADSVWRLPTSASMDTKDIQKTAAQAAESFRTSRKVDQAVPMMEADQVGCYDDVNVENEVMFSPEYDLFLLEDNVFLMDEEDIFSVPWLISSMAEGLMVPPPPQSRDEEAQEHHHLELWSFST